MKRFLIYFTFGILGLYLLNIFSYTIFGKTALVRKILEDTHTSYAEFQWTKDVSITSNLDLESDQISLIRDFYQASNTDIKYLELSEADEVNDIVFSKGKYVHLIEGDNKIRYFLYSVKEFETFEEYTQGYRRTYIWLLAVWLQVGEDFLGIS